MEDVSKSIVRNMSELSEARLWKTLDSISDRLGTIEGQLSTMVRLEERVNHQDAMIKRHRHVVDEYRNKVHAIELWQAHNDSTVLEGMISNVQKELNVLAVKTGALESSNNVNKGQKDIFKEVLKWTVAFLTAILLYKITRG